MSNTRVLVADRNANFLEKTAEILQREGISMVPESNGRRVVALCQHERPDAALIHADLSTLPGTEVCHLLKTQVDPALPVVLMFAEESDSVDAVAQQCQADNFLIRPLKRTELLFCVRSLVRLRRLLLQHEAGTHIFGPNQNKPGGVVGLDAFYTFLGLEMQRVERYGFPLALLFVGVDPLPDDGGAWSNSLNHQLGPALTHAMRSCLREIDISAVLSPREMLILMPHTDAAGARIVAHRVCQAVAAQSYHFGRARIQPTVSVGGASLHGEQSDPEAFIAQVRRNRDHALEAGGNRFYVR